MSGWPLEHTYTHTGKADGAVHREGPPRIKVPPEFMLVWDLPDALFPRQALLKNECTLGNAA